jgi:calcium binding protein 39
MANVNSGSASKPFEWLSGGLFFGNQNKGDGVESIDAEKDVNFLLNRIQEDLNTVISLSGDDKQSSSLSSQSDSLAARLARLRFLLYDERRITTQQEENSHRRGTPSVALDTVESLAAKTDENTLDTLIPELINNLQLLPFESRKHVAAIFNYLLVCGFDGVDRDIYTPVMHKFRDYIELNFEAIVSPIVSGHDVSSASSSSTTNDVALHCGSMYRSCFRHSNLYGQLVVTTRRVEQLVFPLIDKYAVLPNFDVSSDAMESLKLVMTAGTTSNSDNNNDFTATSPIDAKSQQEMAELAATFLIRDYGEVWNQRFNLKLLSIEANYMTKRVALQILSTVLLTRSNYAVMIKYVNSRTNLILVMKLLRDTSPHITLDAFHVFKVFVANPNKIPEVEKILRDNSQKLCAYLETLHCDKEASDQQFADEKRLIIATIRDL